MSRPRPATEPALTGAELTMTGSEPTLTGSELATTGAKPLRPG
jgi:hypothetical protein